MNPLSRKIADALENAVAPALFEAESDPLSLQLDLVAVGDVGLAFNSLTYRDSTLAGKSNDSLKAWAERLASKVTYLMEPLILVELDATAGEAELRSRTPTARGELRSFYQGRLNAKEGSLKLVRFVFNEADGKRSAAPCRMTVEVLERLVDDIATASHH